MFPEYRLRSKGDIQHPCLTPRRIGTFSVASSFQLVRFENRIALCLCFAHTHYAFWIDHTLEYFQKNLRGFKTDIN